MDPDRRAADVDAAERQRHKRERLEATVSGLAELEYVRQRQEELVRAALELREEEQEALQRSSGEKLLQENILLLRKQLNCLRGRDAGLVSQLQELDRQISDLRLDSKVSHDQLETDSRPSSGFYDLSDEVSVSLSNSSNSVFSDCFCSFTEADGGLLSADQPASCLDCDSSVTGFCDDSSWSGGVRHTLLASHPAHHLASLLDPVSPQDFQSKYRCDLVAPNGSDLFYYPSLLHAVAVQSPVLLQMLGYGDMGAAVEGARPEHSPQSASGAATLISQSSSWPASSSSSHAQSCKRLDGYIYGLLQRRALPIRTSRPRTSVSTDLSKSILRHTGFCVRQVSGSGFVTLRGSEFRGGALTGAASSPQRSVASKCEEQVFPGCSVDFKMSNGNSDKNQNIQKGSNNDFDPESGLLRQTRGPPHPPSPVSKASQEFREPNIPKATSSTIDTKQACCLSDLALLLKITPKLPKVLRTKKAVGRGSFSMSLNKGSCAMIAESVAAHQQTIKSCRCRKKVKVKTAVTPRTGRGLEPNERDERRGHQTHRRSGSKMSRLPDGRGSRIRRIPLSTPEGSVLSKHATPGTSRLCRHGKHHYHHRRDKVAVVPNQKHKRNDYRRLHAVTAVPDNEAFKCAQQHQREELCLLAGKISGPYPRSDSEYSAECGSPFHSPIVDTSKDVACGCNTNCFRDRDSGRAQHAGESATSSNTEESGGGGAGGVAGGAGRGVTPAQAKVFIKIKASHNLKKKILRFRSGSLKLMTTM